MKVLHINQSDIVGGASIASYRLHRELLRSSVESHLLVDIAALDEVETTLIQRRRFIEDFVGRSFYKLGLNYLHILGTSKIVETEQYKNADLINLHNLHSGYFNYLAIPKLTRKKPAVFTLHDMWSFTGHCAYSFGCDRWQTGCGNCPHLDTYPAIGHDSTAIEIKLKQWAYNRSNLTFVAPSRWLAKTLESSILSEFSIRHIPNGLDTQTYRPHDPAIGRAALGLPAEKVILLFVAQNLKDPRKGFDLLVSALEQLPASLRATTVLVTMGDGGRALTAIADIPVISLGYVGGDRLKAIIYSTADVFLFPTRGDNLPIVLQESMACGTPMVSFDVGGVSELVRPGDTGLLAKPENFVDLGRCLIEIIEDRDLRAYMSLNCRQIAQAEYGIQLQAQRYVDVYTQAIEAF